MILFVAGVLYGVLCVAAWALLVAASKEAPAPPMSRRRNTV